MLKTLKTIGLVVGVIIILMTLWMATAFTIWGITKEGNLGYTAIGLTVLLLFKIAFSYWYNK